MLKRLKLEYFQRHEELELGFEQGLSCIRAPNEFGKSTVIRGILYALYGARALPVPLTEAVTWGFPDSKLRVELDIEIDGKTLTFTRAKSGAEVLVNGKVFVTGQTEVTNYAAQVLGADLAAARNLMVADQNGLRGALGAGPKAAAEMVESLADFTLFDTLLDRASSRLALGSDVNVKQRLEEAQEKLESLSVSAPDTSAYEAVLKVNPGKVEVLQKQLKEKLEPAHDKARQDLDRAKNNRSTYDLLKNNMEKVENSLAEAKTQFIAAEEKAVPVDTSPIKGLQAQLEGIASRDEQRKVFSALQELNAAYPTTVWEDTVETLHAEIDKTEEEVSDLETKKSELRENHRELSSKSRELQRQIQKDDHCSSCGQLLQNHKEIAQRNKELESEIIKVEEQAELVAKQDDMVSIDLNHKKDYLKDLKAVLITARPFEEFIRQFSSHVQVDLNFVPPKISWKGPEPTEDEIDSTAIRKQISDIEQAAEDARNAKARMETLSQTIKDYEAQLAELTEQVKGYDLDNLEAFQEAHNVAAQAMYAAQNEIEDLQEEMRKAETEIKLAKQLVEQQKAAIKDAEAQVQSYKDEIKQLEFNNGLVKRLRELRPVVGNQLWGLILTAVSTMFTQMRGTQSVVTRDKGGFKVNGQDVDSLSGSTLDLLGLAIRVALIKTFIPNCPFLILDEPFAAADTDRTQDALAFIQAVEIPQVILITHEDVSESVADNLIELTT